MNETRYFARSASDRTDDWPYWYVADRQRGNLNVTGCLDHGWKFGAVFTSRERAIEIAARANAVESA